MKKIASLLVVTSLFSASLFAQNVNTTNGGYEDTRIIKGKKYQVIFEEVAINKTVDEVWNEVAVNFIKIDKVMKGVNFTKCLSGDITYGLGTKRLCNLNYGGKTIEIKEEIIEYKECGDHREFTYYVYDAPDVPLDNYVSWVVRKGEDGKTYLGTVFILRAKIGFLSGAIAKKLRKSGQLKTGVFGYKHYLETGEKEVDPDKLMKMYSSM